MSTPEPSKKMRWAGWIVSAIPVALMLLSAFMKLSRNPQAVEGFAKDGFPAGALLAIGIVEVAVVVVYLIPRTAVLGAILCAAYLGGAVVTHVRHGEAFFIPVLVGVMIWLGLWLRDARLRALVPLRTP